MKNYDLRDEVRLKVDLEARCKNCEFCKHYYAQNEWSFVGCTHEPYKGRWIAEIDICPKSKLNLCDESTSKWIEVHGSFKARSRK